MTASNPGESPKFAQWEIWQATWDHEDGTSKPRPVLILSSERSIKSSDLIWAAKFTKTHVPGENLIKFTRDDPSFSQTGLTDTCYLYPAQARQIHKSKFLHQRGTLPILSAVMVKWIIAKTLKFDP